MRYERYENETLIHSDELSIPETEQEIADREFREAIETATSVAQLKVALLGESGKGRAASRPN